MNVSIYYFFMTFTILPIETLTIFAASVFSFTNVYFLFYYFLE